MTASDPVAPLLDLTPLDDPPTAGEPPVAPYRRVLAAMAEDLAKRFEGGAPVTDLVHGRAAAIDRLLARIWRERLSGEPISLVAVGGYGRGELHPASDIDLMMVLPERDPERYHGRIEALVSFLWDIGLEVGHSTRTPSECAEEARKDLSIATNLMEARLIAGDKSPFLAMREATGSDRMWPSGSFFEAKLEERALRSERYDETAYKLEPNVKEGLGGLRDVQLVGWVLKRHFDTAELGDLVRNDFLTRAECDELIGGREFLWRVRFALHVASGRREDRLLFDHQRNLAARLGYHDDAARLAVEAFMKDYYRTIRNVARLAEMLLELFREAILHADRPARIGPINSRLRTHNDFLEVTRPEVFERNPFTLLEIFLTLQQHPEIKGVRASTIRLIRDNLHRIGAQFRGDVRCRGTFLEMLRQPRGLTHALRRMHDYGVLATCIPAFGRIVGQMQYDLFHAYTVDAHTLFVVRNLRRFMVPEHRDELPMCSRIARGIPKPELLYLAGLFHDVAKGRGGDHSELGAEDALSFCRQLGLGEYDARLVAWLVRQHLILSTTAQREDVSDPEVVHRFARRVGDQTHLDYLYLLTVADIRATSPRLWTAWKAALLRDLYLGTQRALRRGLANPIDQAERLAETRAEARARLPAGLAGDARVAALWEELDDDYFLRHSPGEIAWHTEGILAHGDPGTSLVMARESPRHGGTEVFVYTVDRDFLFATVTTALDQMGLSVVDARIITTAHDAVLDTFIVLEGDGRDLESEARRREVEEVVRERLSRPDAAPPPVRRRPHRHARHFVLEPSVSFQPHVNGRQTLMEVVSSDRPGLLSRVALAMVAHDIRLQGAKIATLGERAEDLFLITDRQGKPLDEGTAQRLEQDILQRLRADA